MSAPLTLSAQPAEPARAAACPWPPITMIFLMSRKLVAKFPEIRGSAGWLLRWSVEAIVWQRHQAEAVRQADDTLEHATSAAAADLALFEKSWANDDEPTRRRCRAHLQALLHASATTHANTETLATTLTPQVPPGIEEER